MKKITLHMIRRNGACRNKIRMFRIAFPNEVCEVTEEDFAKWKKINRDGWRGDFMWLFNRIANRVDFADRLEAKLASYLKITGIAGWNRRCEMRRKLMRMSNKRFLKAIVQIVQAVR